MMESKVCYYYLSEGPCGGAFPSFVMLSLKCNISFETLLHMVTGGPKLWANYRIICHRLFVSENATIN